jgi:Fur family ferric uptake transcriptional regulator
MEFPCVSDTSRAYPGAEQPGEVAGGTCEPSARRIDSVTETALADVLRSRGLRLTAQRQLVLEAVHALGHATPDQVHSKVSETAAGVNITTVYRTLELLEELGLVTHAHLSHGAPTFHGVDEEQHVHLVCRKCQAVEEVPSEMLDQLAGTLGVERGFRLDVGHVALFGECAACAGGSQ